MLIAPCRARKVTIHLNEDTSAGHDFLYSEIFSFLHQRGVAGATMIRPQAGFGSHHRVHSAEAEGALHEHLPVRIEFIETRETVNALMPSLCDLVTDGMIEAHDTTVVKAVREQAR
jgi:PII-like signaling protein